MVLQLEKVPWPKCKYMFARYGLRIVEHTLQACTRRMFNAKYYFLYSFFSLLHSFRDNGVPVIDADLIARQGESLCCF